jgi:hypothetical protein
MMGWNRKPRMAHPVSWELSSTRPYFQMIATHNDATPAELATHMAAAVDFVTTNAARCQSQHILVYAWNEHDEGGWLCPTLGDPTGLRLAAIAPVIS